MFRGIKERKLCSKRELSGSLWIPFFNGMKTFYEIITVDIG
jgi:hypothetical protein